MSTKVKKPQEETGLTPSQEKAALLLAGGMTAREVASAINCTPETISRWKAQPAFEAYYNAIRWDTLEAGRERLRSGVMEAINELLSIAKSGNSDEARRRACMNILELTGYIRSSESGLWGWGVGSTDPVDIVRARKRDEAMKSLDDLFP